MRDRNERTKAVSLCCACDEGFREDGRKSVVMAVIGECCRESGEELGGDHKECQSEGNPGLPGDTARGVPRGGD